MSFIKYSRNGKIYSSALPSKIGGGIYRKHIKEQRKGVLCMLCRNRRRQIVREAIGLSPELKGKGHQAFVEGRYPKRDKQACKRKGEARQNHGVYRLSKACLRQHVRRGVAALYEGAGRGGAEKHGFVFGVRNQKAEGW